MYIRGKNILLGITGGIAAYKVAELCRAFTKKGARVKVMMTRAATEFVGPLTFESLSNNPVSTDLFPDGEFSSTHHIDLADWADLVVVAPATANFIAKLIAGIGDDLLTTVMLAVHSPTVIVPAMNTNMWNNPITQRNITDLKNLGKIFCPPESGDLACGYTGDGRLASMENILTYCNYALAPKDLKGKNVLINSGPTIEDIDGVRFLSNRSTGKMGNALAIEAFCRGANVQLVLGPSNLPEFPGIETSYVRSASEMFAKTMELQKNSDIFIAASAVADFTPAEQIVGKIKKEKQGNINLELKPTGDILSAIGEKKGKIILVGFALEIDDPDKNALAKLKNKNLDAIILNNPQESGAAFEHDTNKVKIFTADKQIFDIPLSSKINIARSILDSLSYLWSK